MGIRMERKHWGEMRELLEALYSNDVSELCWYFGLPYSGTKNRKINRILKSDLEYQDVKRKVLLLRFASEILQYFYSDELSEILDDLDLPVSGNKDEKILRIVFSDMVSPRELLETRVTDEIDEIYSDLFDEENELTRNSALDRILHHFDITDVETEREEGDQTGKKREKLDLDNLKKFLETEEGQTLEFKSHKILGRKIDIAKILCAFANRDGGKLLIGVSDDRTLSGMKAKEKYHEDYIRQIARFRCAPPVPLTFQVVSSTQGDVYVIEVLRKKPRSTPFGVKTKVGGTTYFVRDGSMVVEAHPSELKDIID
ncbi:MAG: ATP-binding protein [Methanomassiliicoccales archaeon]|nr:MAG: ATP-binding protein [Methanomassiliicoccales archaeon]